MSIQKAIEDLIDELKKANETGSLGGGSSTSSRRSSSTGSDNEDDEFAKRRKRKERENGVALVSGVRDVQVQVGGLLAFDDFSACALVLCMT